MLEVDCEVEWIAGSQVGSQNHCKEVELIMSEIEWMADRVPYLLVYDFFDF